MRMQSLMILVIAVGACRGGDEHGKAPRPARQVLASATQADLARELDEADRRGTWREVKQRWIGQPLHWTVTRQRALCRSATACNVAAFPVQRPATHGWLPGIAFAPGEFEKLDTACGTAEQCEVVIDGTLAELAVSPELPTSLRLAGVRVVTAKRS